jgi:hypothetical protein
MTTRIPQTGTPGIQTTAVLENGSDDVLIVKKKGFEKSIVEIHV